LKLIQFSNGLSQGNCRARLAARPESHGMSTSPAIDIDYDSLMQANLIGVFGERDAVRRLETIRALCTEDAVLNEPHATARGHSAICDAVSALLASLPSDFAFTALAPACGHHGVGRLQWRSGPAGGSAAVTGMGIAQFEGSRIRVLTVLLDPPTA
jgi:hypothetical protein